MNEYSMSLIIEAERCARSASRILKGINHNFAFGDEARLEGAMLDSVTAMLDSVTAMLDSVTDILDEVSESLYQKASIEEESK